MTSRQAAEMAELHTLIGVLAARNITHAGDKADLTTTVNILQAQLSEMKAKLDAIPSADADPLGR